MFKLYTGSMFVKTTEIVFCLLLFMLVPNCEIIGQAIYPSPALGGLPDSVMTIGISPGSFSANLPDNTVHIGGIAASVLNATTSQLTVKIPHGSFYSLVSATTNGNTYYSWAPFITLFDNYGVPSLALNSFANKIDFPAGAGPGSIASGDFDGDGKADLVVVNSSANSISILKNTSTTPVVSFAAKADIAAAPGPNHAVVADIDGDGKLDIVVVNTSSNSVSVFRNTTSSTSITFAAKVDFITGNSPYKCTVNDFDLDGKLDIAVVNRSNDNSVSVLANNRAAIGQVSFKTKVDFPTGNYPIDIASDDFNQDSRPELAIVNYFSNTLSIYKNGSVPGSVYFEPKIDYATGAFPIGVVSGYILNNFKRDIAVANFVDNSVSVFTHYGSASQPTFNSKIDFPAGTGPVALLLNDMDGNGYADILTANQTANSVSVLRNTVNPNIVAPAFAPKLDFATGTMPNNMVSADFDNDGRPDMATVNYNSNNISVIRNKAGDSATSRTITVCPNSSNSITASVSGTMFTWQSDGGGNGYFNISPSDQGFSGVNSATLTIPITYSFFNGWKFRCVVNGFADKPVAVKVAETWTGAADSQWENVANWDCGVIPDYSTDVIISKGPVIINSNAQCRSLKVNPGVNVNINTGFSLQVAH